MNENPERRDKTRFSHEAPVTLENDEIGLLHGVRMYNYSSTGIYFETNFYLQPGTGLYIGIKSSPLADESDVYECYRAVIKWRKFLEESSFDYGYGLQLSERVPQTLPEEIPSTQKDEKNRELRRHARKKCSIPALVSTPDDTFDVLINNISKGGIFFSTRQQLSQGQSLDLMIPMRNKGKLLKRRGTVIWCENEGVGVKFQPPDRSKSPRE
jgi:hypothetical protein